MGAKRKGALAASAKMTALAGKETEQQKPSMEAILEGDLLKQIRHLLLELEQRISLQLLQIGTKVDNLQQQICGINKQIGELKQETKQLKKEVEAVEVDTKILKSSQQDLQANFLRLLLYKLRIKNFPGSTEEQSDGKIIKWLSEISQLSEQNIQRAIDVIFRIQSKQAKKAETAGELMVKFLSRDVRDTFFEWMAYKKHVIADQKVLILKDVPYEIRQRWLPYKELTTLLREHQVKYRWLIPEGLSFVFKEKSHVIKSLEDLNQFQKDKVEMFGRPARQDSKKTRKL